MDISRLRMDAVPMVLPPEDMVRPMENTAFFTELWGWFFVLFAVAFLIRGPKRLVADLTGIVATPANTIIIGYTVMIGGLISILQYNVWDRGILEAVLSLFGWMMLAKGLVFLAFPVYPQEKMKILARYPLILPIALVLCIVLGAYLLALGYHFL